MNTPFKVGLLSLLIPRIRKGKEREKMEARLSKIRTILLCSVFLIMAGAGVSQAGEYMFNFDNIDISKGFDDAAIETYMEGVMGLGPDGVTVTGAIFGGEGTFDGNDNASKAMDALLVEDLNNDGVSTDLFVRDNASSNHSFSITFNTVAISSVSFDYGAEKNDFYGVADETQFFEFTSGSNNGGFSGPSGIFTFSDPGVTTLTFHDSNSGLIGIDNLKVTTVPVPGAVWLLSSSLLGLAGMRRKYRK